MLRRFESSESANFAIFGSQKRTRKRQQLALLYSSIVHAEPESQRCGDSGLQRALILPFLVAKKGQEKDKNSHFYIHRSFTLILKVNAGEIRVWKFVSGNSDCPSSKSQSGKQPLTPSESDTICIFTTQKLSKNEIRLLVANKTAY